MGSLCISSLSTTRLEEVIVSNSLRVPESLKAKGYPFIDLSSEFSENESFSENSQFLILPPASSDFSRRSSQSIHKAAEDDKWNLKTNDNTPPLLKKFCYHPN